MSMLHPGFNKTDMTKKYEAIWEIEGEEGVGSGEIDTTLLCFYLNTYTKCQSIRKEPSIHTQNVNQLMLVCFSA